MLRAVLLNPILLALSSAIGVACCHAGHLNPHARELMLAAVVFVIASQTALTPMLFSRRRTAMALTQAALIGLVLHLILAMALSVAILLTTKPSTAFAYWSLLFYWTTLCGLAFVFIRAVRTATPAQQH